MWNILQAERVNNTYSISAFSMSIALRGWWIRFFKCRVIIGHHLQQKQRWKLPLWFSFSNKCIHITYVLDSTSASLCLLAWSSSTGDGGLLTESSARPLDSSLGLLAALGVRSPLSTGVTELLAGGEGGFVLGGGSSGQEHKGIRSGSFIHRYSFMLIVYTEITHLNHLNQWQGWTCPGPEQLVPHLVQEIPQKAALEDWCCEKRKKQKQRMSRIAMTNKFSEHGS